jgi:hypothetical protein
MIFMLFEGVLNLAQNTLKFKFVKSSPLESTQLTVVHGLRATSCRAVVLLGLPVLETALAEYHFTFHTLRWCLCRLLANSTDEILIEGLVDSVFFARPVSDRDSSSCHFLNNVFEIADINSYISGRLGLKFGLGILIVPHSLIQLSSVVPIHLG